MERSTKTCALFIVNRSDYIFESTMSSIVRTFETFDIDLLLVFYAGFTRNLFNAQSLGDSKSYSDGFKKKERR